MKRLLFLAGIVIVGTALVGGAIIAWMVLAPQMAAPPVAASPPPPAKLRPLPDVDALAARMKHDQDIYQSVSAAALSAYAKLHPAPAPSDDEAHAALKLISYLCVWDDYYGEGLRDQLDRHLHHLKNHGNNDPTWTVYEIVDNFMHHHSGDEAYAAKVAHEMIAYDSTPYPALFRLCALRASIKDLIYPQIDPDTHLGHAPDALPELANRAVAGYRALLDNNFRHYFFYAQADILFDTRAG